MKPASHKYSENLNTYETIYCNVTLTGNGTENVQRHFLHANFNRKF